MRNGIGHEAVLSGQCRARGVPRGPKGPLGRACRGIYDGRHHRLTAADQQAQIQLSLSTLTVTHHSTQRCTLYSRKHSATRHVVPCIDLPHLLPPRTTPLPLCGGRLHLLPHPQLSACDGINAASISNHLPCSTNTSLNPPSTTCPASPPSTPTSTDRSERRSTSPTRPAAARARTLT